MLPDLIRRTPTRPEPEILHPRPIRSVAEAQSANVPCVACQRRQHHPPAATHQTSNWTKAARRAPWVIAAWPAAIWSVTQAHGFPLLLALFAVVLAGPIIRDGQAPFWWPTRQIWWPTRQHRASRRTHQAGSAPVDWRANDNGPAGSQDRLNHRAAPPFSGPTSVDYDPVAGQFGGIDTHARVGTLGVSGVQAPAPSVSTAAKHTAVGR